MLTRSSTFIELSKSVEDLRVRVTHLEGKIRKIQSLNTIEEAKTQPIVYMEKESLVEGLVYPLLSKWILEPAESRVGQWAKKNIASNEVRQLLFDRQKKAESKPEYEGGLKVESGDHDSLEEGAKKLGDAIFFIFKHLKRNKYKETRTSQVASAAKLKLVEDLATLVTNIVLELKK